MPHGDFHLYLAPQNLPQDMLMPSGGPNFSTYMNGLSSRALMNVRAEDNEIVVLWAALN
jgi:hypothetical protein